MVSKSIYDAFKMAHVKENFLAFWRYVKHLNHFFKTNLIFFGVKMDYQLSKNSKFCSKLSPNFKKFFNVKIEIPKYGNLILKKLLNFP